jgi:hypothetical protein
MRLRITPDDAQQITTMEEFTSALSTDPRPSERTLLCSQRCSAKDTRKNIRELAAGTSAHHKQSATLNLRTSDGSISSTSAATIAVAQPYCQKLSNRDVAPVDQTALDEIEQRPVISRLAEPPTYDEFEKSMSKLANGKAPGEHYSALLSMSSTEFTTITGQTQRLFTKNGPLRSFGCYTRVKAILLNSRIIEASFSKTSLLVS